VKSRENANGLGAATIRLGENEGTFSRQRHEGPQKPQNKEKWSREKLRHKNVNKGPKVWGETGKRVRRDPDDLGTKVNPEKVVKKRVIKCKNFGG